MDTSIAESNIKNQCVSNSIVDYHYCTPCDASVDILETFLLTSGFDLTKLKFRMTWFWLRKPWLNLCELRDVIF